MPGYEISGFEKIPDEGPALLVYYHGALPVDLYYLIANVILHKRRCLRAIGDRFLFIIPGFNSVTTSTARLGTDVQLHSICPAVLFVLSCCC